MVHLIAIGGCLMMMAGALRVNVKGADRLAWALALPGWLIAQTALFFL